MTMRCGTARSIVLAMRFGHSLRAAVDMAIEDLAQLTTGFLAGVVIHAIDVAGNHEVASFQCPEDIKYWIWEAEERSIRKTGLPGNTIHCSQHKGKFMKTMMIKFATLALTAAMTSGSSAHAGVDRRDSGTRYSAYRRIFGRGTDRVP